MSQLIKHSPVEMRVQSILAEVIGLSVIGIFTLPSIVIISRCPYRRKGTTSWGDTKDGNTTAISKNSFNTKTPKLYLSIFLVLGLFAFILKTFQLGSTDYFLEKLATNTVGWVSDGPTSFHDCDANHCSSCWRYKYLQYAIQKIQS